MVFICGFWYMDLGFSVFGFDVFTFVDVVIIYIFCYAGALWQGGA